MKKAVYQCAGAVLTAGLILLCLFKVVDMHRDGIQIRDGFYYVYTQYASGSNQLALNVNGGIEMSGANIQLWPNHAGTTQQFYLENIGDNKFYILFGNNGMCLGIAADGVNVELQPYTGQENQQWEMEHIGKTQYYVMKNTFNGFVMQALKTEEHRYYNIIVAQETEDPQNYYFMLKR